MKKLFLITIYFISITFTFANNKESKNTTVGYYGDIFYLISDPKDSKDVKDSYRYYKNGVIYVKNGKIQQIGNFNKISKNFPNAKVISYKNKLIIPGLIDAHIHYPQMEMMASYGDQLLDWLNKYTFPTEKKYSDYKYANKKAKAFINQLINNGTTSAAIYATVYPNSVDAIFSQAFDKNMRIITGKVMMDRNAPRYLLDTPESAYRDSKKLIEKWHNKGRLLYAVTPRFAISSTDKELEMASKLLKEYPDVYMQTHLAENKDEIAFVQELFPWSTSYLDVYNHFGLVTNHSIFGHSIYLSKDNFKLLHDKESSIAFCPTSNLFLGSGLFNLQMAQKENVKIGFGTDVGAGTSMSILATMNEGYKISNLRKDYDESYKDYAPLNSFEAFYYATLGSAKALDIDKYVGSFAPGKEADFIVLNPNNPKILSQNNENNPTLEQKLFKIMMLGDDRTVEHVYIYGKQQK